MLSKISSASKLIGEILIPALLSKDSEVQAQLTFAVPVVACMAMGMYSIILEHNTILGHSIFKNTALNISVICYTCHNHGNKQHDVFLNEINKEHLEINRDEFDVTPSQQSILNGLRNLFAKFLNVKVYTNVNNTQFWMLLERLCNHYNVFDHGVSTEIINEENIKYILKPLKIFIKNSKVSNLNIHCKTFIYRSYNKVCISFSIYIFIFTYHTSPHFSLN